MKSISKYPLSPAGRQTIMMPRGAQILCAQAQATAQPAVWVLVDLHEHVLEERDLMLVGTGMQIDDTNLMLTPIDTIQLDGGALIVHVFEVAGTQ